MPSWSSPLTAQWLLSPHGGVTERIGDGLAQRFGLVVGIIRAASFQHAIGPPSPGLQPRMVVQQAPTHYMVQSWITQHHVKIAPAQVRNDAIAGRNIGRGTHLADIEFRYLQA